MMKPDWALLGFAVAGALLSTLILTIMVRKRPKEFAPEHLE